MGNTKATRYKIQNNKLNNLNTIDTTKLYKIQDIAEYMVMNILWINQKLHTPLKCQNTCDKSTHNVFVTRGTL